MSWDEYMRTYGYREYPCQVRGGTMKNMMFPEMSFEETFNGEPITALREFKGKLLIFTPNHIYIARRPRWYEKIWHWLVGLRMVVARKLVNLTK